MCQQIGLRSKLGFGAGLRSPKHWSRARTFFLPLILWLLLGSRRTAESTEKALINAAFSFVRDRRAAFLFSSLFLFLFLAGARDAREGEAVDEVVKTVETGRDRALNYFNSLSLSGLATGRARQKLLANRNGIGFATSEGDTTEDPRRRIDSNVTERNTFPHFSCCVDLGCLVSLEIISTKGMHHCCKAIKRWCRVRSCVRESSMWVKDDTKLVGEQGKDDADPQKWWMI